MVGHQQHRVGASMKRVQVLLVGLTLLVPSLAFAKEPKRVNQGSQVPKESQHVLGADEFQALSLQQLKAVNPEAYEVARQRLERQRQMQDVVQAYREQKLSPRQAEEQLWALVRQEVEMERADAETHLRVLRERLAELELVMKDPQRAVQQRVDRLMGKTTEQDSPAR